MATRSGIKAKPENEYPAESLRGYFRYAEKIY